MNPLNANKETGQDWAEVHFRPSPPHRACRAGLPVQALPSNVDRQGLNLIRDRMYGPEIGDTADDRALQKGSQAGVRGLPDTVQLPTRGHELQLCGRHLQRSDTHGTQRTGTADIGFTRLPNAQRGKQERILEKTAQVRA